MNKRSKSSNDIFKIFEARYVPEQKQLIPTRPQLCLKETNYKKQAKKCLTQHEQKLPKGDFHSKIQLFQNKENIPPVNLNEKLKLQKNSIKEYKCSSLSIKNNCYGMKQKSIYEQYRERINGGIVKDNGSQLKNSLLKNLRYQNEELKNQILEDIGRLRLVRQRSQKTLKKSESYTKISNAIEQKTMEPEELKKKFIQKYRQKLNQIK